MLYEGSTEGLNVADGQTKGPTPESVYLFLRMCEHVPVHAKEHRDVGAWEDKTNERR